MIDSNTNNLYKNMFGVSEDFSFKITTMQEYLPTCQENNLSKKRAQESQATGRDGNFEAILELGKVQRHFDLEQTPQPCPLKMPSI